MIFGVGTDICDVRRIAATLSRRGERFAEKVLGPHEIEVYRARRSKVEARGISYLATRFSAKEAFAKAIGLGMRMPMTWRDCEVVKAASGKPQIRLHGALAAWFDARGLRAHLSVTDETDYAASFVVVEQNEPRNKP
jgi:holo-[acyl-carrier protein] synthase